MPYTAKSLAGAQRRVRELERAWKNTTIFLDKIAGENKELQEHIVELAKLAAEGPCFDNPLIVYEVKKYRDQILRAVGLNPDGTFAK